MENTAHHNWFTEHRGWEDFCSALFGGLIILSPVIDGTNTVITVNAGIFGVLIVGLALVEFMSLQRWEEITSLRWLDHGFTVCDAIRQRPAPDSFDTGRRGGHSCPV